MVRLFRDTVLTVNVGDYTDGQVRAWAGRADSLLARDAEFREIHTVVAVAAADGEIVGFGTVDDAGYLDLLYVHRGWQRRGVASSLCDDFEAYARGRGASSITVHASITACPFFERRGYKVERRRTVTVDGVAMDNFAMAKPL